MQNSFLEKEILTNKAAAGDCTSERTYNIIQNAVTKMIMSMLRRCETIVVSKGSYTGYRRLLIDITYTDLLVRHSFVE